MVARRYERVVVASRVLSSIPRLGYRSGTSARAGHPRSLDSTIIVTEPILFILGPSGVGKSTVAPWVADALEFLYLEIDRFPEGDGIDLAGLRQEWDAFCHHANSVPLANTVRARLRSKNKRGAVLSFPGLVVPTPEAIAAAEPLGIRFVILYGTEAECLNAFLEREADKEHGLDPLHWISHNAESYARFSVPTFAKYRVSAFGPTGRRSRSELIQEVRERLTI